MHSIKPNPKDIFSMLIKFGQKGNLENLQKGNLYMKNLKYYNNLETNGRIAGMGDKYDGKALLNKFKFSMFDNETDELFLSGYCPQGTLDLGYENNPVFCLYNFDRRNYIKEELKGNNLKIYFGFTDVQKEKLQIEFGNYALLITNGDEFTRRMKESFLKNGISFSRDKITYIDFNENLIQHYSDFKKENYRIAFWKDKNKFEYQQEYRYIAFDTQVEDNLQINIGDIKDITQLVESKKLLNCEIRIECIVKKED